MKKTLCYIVKSNLDLCIAIKDLKKSVEIIHKDFDEKLNGDDFDVENIEYTIKPQLMTEERYSILSKKD